MQLITENLNHALVIHVARDRIDAASAIQFKDQMREATQSPAARVILDMAQVAFIDSSGLGALVAAYKALAPERALELVHLTPTVKKVFRLTRMDTIFIIHETMPAELATAC